MTFRLPSPVVRTLALTLLLASPTLLRAAAINENLPDASGLTQLELRAQQAKPREQCFLYTELVHVMTEVAGKQMLAGQTDEASATLKRVAYYASMIHMNLANDTKKLKDAELLMHHTTHQLGEYLRAASGDDRTTLQTTLKQLDQVHDELLAQVFTH